MWDIGAYCLDEFRRKKFFWYKYFAYLEKNSHSREERYKNGESKWGRILLYNGSNIGSLNTVSIVVTIYEHISFRLKGMKLKLKNKDIACLSRV